MISDTEINKAENVIRLSDDDLNKVTGGEFPDWLRTVAKVLGESIISVYMQGGGAAVLKEAEKTLGSGHWVTALVRNAIH